MRMLEGKIYAACGCAIACICCDFSCRLRLAAVRSLAGQIVTLEAAALRASQPDRDALLARSDRMRKSLRGCLSGLPLYRQKAFGLPVPPEPGSRQPPQPRCATAVVRPFPLSPAVP